MQVADPPPLRITEEPDGDGTLLRLAGELDLATADELRARLSAIAGRRTPRIVVDVGGLEFVDVTGLNVLLDAQREAAERTAGFVLRRPRPMLLRLLGLLQLDDAIEIDR